MNVKASLSFKSPRQIPNLKNPLHTILLKIQSTDADLQQKIFCLLVQIILLNWYLPVIQLSSTSLHIIATV